MQLHFKTTHPRTPKSRVGIFVGIFLLDPQGTFLLRLKKTSIHENRAHTIIIIQKHRIRYPHPGGSTTPYWQFRLQTEMKKYAYIWVCFFELSHLNFTLTISTRVVFGSALTEKSFTVNIQPDKISAELPNDTCSDIR